MQKLLQRQTIREILELSERPTMDEIKANYRRLMKKYHPDVCKEQGAEEFCKRVNKAYEICIGKQQVRRPMPPPRSQGIVITVYYGYGGYGSTSYTYTTGTNAW